RSSACRMNTPIELQKPCSNPVCIATSGGNPSSSSTWLNYKAMKFSANKLLFIYLCVLYLRFVAVPENKVSPIHCLSTPYWSPIWLFPYYRWAGSCCIRQAACEPLHPYLGPVPVESRALDSTPGPDHQATTVWLEWHRPYDLAQGTRLPAQAP